MIRIITCTDLSKRDAGPKAKEDVVRIMKNNYGEKILEKTIDEDFGASSISKLLKLLKKICVIFSTCHFNKDKIVIQYPMSSQFELLSLFPHKRTIVIIHDLQGLRTLNKRKELREIKQLKKFQYIISHNAQMKKYLIEKGLKKEKIYRIELFDYLSKYSNSDQNSPKDDVAFVGNLSKAKAPFIYQLDENKMNFNLHLYGTNISKNLNKKEIYEGSFEPTELPMRINQKYGLVWDGNTDESDENISYKNYTKYNNPHKLSCYLASGIPVIVWQKSAVADFVKKNNIGYLINTIYDINKINNTDYETKRRNALKMQKKVTTGYFTSKVFKEIIG